MIYRRTNVLMPSSWMMGVPTPHKSFCVEKPTRPMCAAIGAVRNMCNMYGFYAACSSICAMKRFQGLMASARMAAPTNARQNQRKMVVPQPSHSATKPNR